MDNKKVGDIIRELCLGTEAEAWLGNKKGGKECMTALRLHYDGSDEVESYYLDTNVCEPYDGWKAKGFSWKTEDLKALIEMAQWSVEMADG